MGTCPGWPKHSPVTSPKTHELQLVEGPPLGPFAFGIGMLPC
jgi:hypothetical protein